MAMEKSGLLLGLLGFLAIASVRSGEAGEASHRDLHGRFTFSGVFVPSHVDTNGDGFGAVVATDRIAGKLKDTTKGGKRLRRIRLVSQSKMLEYRPTNPNHDCFRVSEEDFSVEENAYKGPLFELVSPIRTEPVASNPLLVPYSAENWTTFYRLSTGELLYAEITELQVCIENVPPDVSPWPLCHVRWRERILGGTGRFKDATGEVALTAISPTASANGPIFDRNGAVNLVFPPEGPFVFGPSYGAGEMEIELPPADEDD